MPNGILDNLKDILLAMLAATPKMTHLFLINIQFSQVCRLTFKTWAAITYLLVIDTSLRYSRTYFSGRRIFRF